VKSTADIGIRSLAEMTARDLSHLTPLLAVPVGSCEQHGPHLPLATDTIVATALCERLARRRADVVVAPALPVTASGEHAGFPGTLSIGTEATRLLLVEYARSADWAAGIILVNGHGGNHGAVARAVDVVRAEGRWIHAWWPDISRGDAHAGRTETSLMLAIRPDLVRWQAVEAGDSRPLADILGDLRSGGVMAVSANGVLGDPTAATLDEGIRLLDLLTDDLVASVEDVLTLNETTPRRPPAT